MARLLLFGGKGGVGKTTVAAATAIWLADSGFRVLLVSSDPAHSTSDSLEFKLGTEPTEVDGVENLWGMEMDPAERMGELLPRLSEALEGGLGGNMQNFLGAGVSEGIAKEVSDLDAADLLLPGLDEALAFDKLLSFVQDSSYDVLVFDTAPTGHTLRFLGLPEILDGWVGRIIRLARLTGGIRSVLMGRRQERAMQEELARFQRRVAHVRRLLTDPAVTSFTLVSIPEKMAVDETVRAARSLSEIGIDVNGVLVNRITPDLDHPFIQQRRQIEQVHLQQLKEHFDELPVAEVPLEAGDIHGLEGLRRLGSSLNGDAPDIPDGMEEIIAGKAIPFKIRRGLALSLEQGHLVVQLHLPGADGNEVDVSIEEETLKVHSNGKTWTVDLGHRLSSDRRRVQFADDILRVTLEL